MCESAFAFLAGEEWSERERCQEMRCLLCARIVERTSCVLFQRFVGERAKKVAKKEKPTQSGTKGMNVNDTIVCLSPATLVLTLWRTVCWSSGPGGVVVVASMTF